MPYTSGNEAGSKVTYLAWGREDASANNGTFLVNHANDRLGSRIVSVRDNQSNGGLGKLVPSSEYDVELMSDTQVKITNKCGVAAITTPAVKGATNTGTAITFTAGGAYTGKADGKIKVKAVRAGATVGATTVVTPGVLAGSGSATTLTTSGTYTGSVNGVAVGTVTATGEAGTATLDWVFPDGSVVEGWVSGATTVAKGITQGVSLAMTSGAGDDLVIGDTITITLWGKPQIQATFPDGTVGDVVDCGATTVGADIGQGVTLAFTTQAGVDIQEGDEWDIAVQAGTKDLTAFVQVVGY